MKKKFQSILKLNKNKIQLNFLKMNRVKEDDEESKEK